MRGRRGRKGEKEKRRRGEKEKRRRGEGERGRGGERGAKVRWFDASKIG